MDTSLPVALVAGASRGLGLLIARRLLAQGYRVALCSRDAESVDRAVQLLRDHGSVRGYVCDVGDRAAVADLVAAVEQELGPVEVAITVAGVIAVGPAASMTLEHFDEALDTMVRGPVHVAWAVLPGMRSRRAGRIGTVTSVGGTVAPPHLLPYATAKFGAVGFSEGLTAELAGTGVSATTIIPGLLRTGSHEQARFVGDHGAEYAWFAPAASLPGVSMDAERAAGRIVRGVLQGRSHVVLTPLASVGMRVHGIAPASTVRLMGLVTRLLPDAPTPAVGATVSGRVAGAELGSRTVRALTVLGSRAAARLNQRPRGTP